MTRIEPGNGTVRQLESKRFNLPFVIHSDCPQCGREVRLDMNSDDGMLRYPRVGVPLCVGLWCSKCSREWDVYVRLECSLTLVPPVPSVTTFSPAPDEG